MKDDMRVRRHSAPRLSGAADSELHRALSRVIKEPVAAKVPEIIALFWVVKILTTAGGEATSDYFRTLGNIGGGGVEVALFLIGLIWQFGTRRYRAFSYWFLAYAIAIFGTGVSDFLHLDVGIPYAGTTILWAVVLSFIFWLWYHYEGTLSIHSITTRDDAKPSIGPRYLPPSLSVRRWVTLRRTPSPSATSHRASSSAFSY